MTTPDIIRELALDIAKSHEMENDILKRLQAGEAFDFIKAYEEWEAFDRPVRARLRNILKTPHHRW